VDKRDVEVARDIMTYALYADAKVRKDEGMRSAAPPPKRPAHGSGGGGGGGAGGGAGSSSSSGRPSRQPAAGGAGAAEGDAGGAEGDPFGGAGVGSKRKRRSGKARQRRARRGGAGGDDVDEEEAGEDEEGEEEEGEWEGDDDDSDGAAGGDGATAARPKRARRGGGEAAGSGDGGAAAEIPWDEVLGVPRDSGVGEGGGGGAGAPEDAGDSAEAVMNAMSHADWCAVDTSPAAADPVAALAFSRAVTTFIATISDAGTVGQVWRHIIDSAAAEPALRPLCAADGVLFRAHLAALVQGEKVMVSDGIMYPVV
jgi:hypothetical protein